jgi:DNA-directed RNA polymerase subunit RPC12/RpoP
MKKLVNVTCERCSQPLFAFEKQPNGSTLMRSFGAGVRIDPIRPSVALAVCMKCGAETVFDRELLPKNI